MVISTVWSAPCWIMIDGSPTEFGGGENIATFSAFADGALLAAVVGDALPGAALLSCVAAVRVFMMLAIETCFAKAPTSPTTCTFHPEGSCALYQSTTSSKRLEVMIAAVVW